MKRSIVGCAWPVLLIAAVLCIYGTASAVGGPPSILPPPNGGTPPVTPAPATPASPTTPAPGAAPVPPVLPGGTPAATPPAGDSSKTTSGSDNKALDVPSLEPEPVDHNKNVKTSTKRDRDPVAAAFAVPPGTQLTKKQTDALKKLKDEKEPLLKAALKKMDEATQGADKTAEAHKVRDLTKEIHTEVQTILDMPDTTNQQPPAQRTPQPYRRQAYPSYRYF